MKRQKGSILQRMMAMLLTAVLLVSMASDAVPMTVLANEEGGQQENMESSTPDGQQEIVEGNTADTMEGETKTEEGTKTPPAEKTNPGERKPDDGANSEMPETSGGGVKPEPQKPDDGTEQETPEPGEGATEPGTVSGNDAAPEMTAAPQGVMLAAEPAPQAEIIAGSESDGWILDADGKLTISSDEGMSDWCDKRLTPYDGAYYKEYVTSAEIQNGVTSIVMNAFAECSLTNISISSGVTSIGGSAFSCCSGLTYISIPSGVTSIGNHAFYGCTSLASVTMQGETPPTIENDAFTDCKFVTDGDGATGIHVPAGKAEAYKAAEGWEAWAEYIVDDAASAEEETSGTCGDNLTWTLADGVLTISGTGAMTNWGPGPGESPFTRSDIKTVVINRGVTSIGDYAFYKCSGLTSITIPAGVTSIGVYSFFKCSELTGITIPASTENVYSYAFRGCSSLNDVTMQGETPPRAWADAFADCKFVQNNTQGIHVPAGTAETYKAAEGWDAWAEYIVDDAEHEHDGVTFTPWTFTTSLPEAAGNYCLTKDVILPYRWDVPSGVTNLCLNGKTISNSSNDPADSYAIVIGIDMSCTLNLYDCQNTGNITGGKNCGVSNAGTFHMYGGKISGNTGGGVYVVGGGTFAVGGGAVVSGNTADGAASNVYLSNGRTITVASENPLSDSAKIGVTTYSAPTEGNPVNITGANSADYSKYFTSDNPAYEIVNANDVVQLALKTETPSESGTVTPEVKPGENAPGTNISTPAEELKDMLLTDDEKQQVQSGTNIRIVLEVQDAGNTVSASDRAAVAQTLNGYTVGQYLNIDLYKLVGADRTDITETTKKIRIVITVPDSLKNADSSKTRAFAVIRVHDGRAEFLTDLDNSADTITIETDRFSTYAIVYKDTANGGSGDEGDQGGGDDNGNGGGNSGGGDNGSGSGNSGGGDNGSGSGNNGGGDNGSGSGNNGGDSGNGNGSNGGSADQNGGNNNGSGSNSGGKNSRQNSSAKITTGQGSEKDDEPKTGDAAHIDLYATLAMIAGIAYLLLYFTDRERGMTQERKKELVSRLIRWAKQGGRGRKYLALAAIFVLLVYYHGIGKKMCVRWKAVYGE